MVSRATRLARGGTAAVFATLAAFTSHILGGGALPSPAALALALAFALLVCIALAGRTLSLWRTSLAVGISQFAFHGLFGGMSSGSATVVTDAMPGHTEHLLMVMAPIAPAVAHSSWMTLAHALAGVATIAALRRGELALRGLIISAVLALGILFRLPLVDAPSLPLATPDWSRSTVPHAQAVLLAGDPRRGPPIAAAFL